MIHFSKTAGNLELSLGLPSLFQSVGFGGLVGLLITYLICLNYPVVASAVAMKYVLAFGAAFGSCVHRLLDVILIKGLAGSVRRRVAYYTKVAELEINKNLIDPATHTSIKSGLDHEYFLGSKQANRKLLSRID